MARRGSENNAPADPKRRYIQQWMWLHSAESRHPERLNCTARRAKENKMRTRTYTSSKTPACLGNGKNKECFRRCAHDDQADENGRQRKLLCGELELRCTRAVNGSGS